MEPHWLQWSFDLSWNFTFPVGEVQLCFKSCKIRIFKPKECILGSFVTFYQWEVRKLRLTTILENFDLSQYLWLDQCKVSVWSNQWMELHQIFSEWHKCDIELIHSVFIRNSVKLAKQDVYIRKFYKFEKIAILLWPGFKTRQECGLTCCYV